MKSRKDVPSVFQRVAEALELGLDDDALVWYEPLYDPTRDRSGRGERPHFVVLEPRRGILVLEVVDVEKSALLGVLRGKMRLARDGREVEVDNPVQRATAFAEVLRERIRADEKLAGLDIAVGAAAVFPKLTAEEAAEKGVERLVPLDCALFGPDIRAALAGDGSARLLRVLARLLGSGPEELPPDFEARMRRVVQPEIAIERVATFESASKAAPGSEASQLTLFRAPQDRETHVRVMDRQQESIAKGLGSGHRVLRGVAGSGKTLMLVYRAKLLARANPRHHILLTCYTRSLASYLRQLLAAFENVEVTHLDRVMQRVLAAAKMKHPGFEGDESGEEAARLARQALASGAGQRYEAVLLDEGQDFGIEALRFVTELLKPGHNDLVIAMDGAQNIFRRKFSLKQAGVQAAGRTRVLKRNYRNTGEIGAFAYRFLTASAKTKADATEEEGLLEPLLDEHAGTVPTVVRVASVDDELREAVRRVQAWLEGGRAEASEDAAASQSEAATAQSEAATAQSEAAAGQSQAAAAQSDATAGQSDGTAGQSEATSGQIGSAAVKAAIGPREVAVLYTRPERERARRLYRALLRAKVAVFWVNDPDHPDNRDRIGSAAEPVVLSTVYSAKGFEYPRVLLLGVFDPRQGPEESRKLAYVGMTRATAELTVIIGDKEPLSGDLR